MPFGNNEAKQEIQMTKIRQKVSDCLRTLTGPEQFCTIPSYVATPEHLLDVTQDSCYMPNRARRFDRRSRSAHFDMCRVLPLEEVEQQDAWRSGDADSGFLSPCPNGLSNGTLDLHRHEFRRGTTPSW
jgi:hypothetical protein